MRLDFSAISDVGRVRKDNQDSGYVGPHLVAVCDGVGGAARGDIASSTAIAQLRKLEETRPARTSEATCSAWSATRCTARTTGSPSWSTRTPPSTAPAPPPPSRSSTAQRVGMGHVGDSRAYLFRDGEISQLTNDHTFVQTLIDEGRITEAEARVHPHRNLILRAIDGIHDLEPDLFVLELQLGDRLLLCSDGASGVLDAGRLADILSSGTPDYAAVELVRASLEAGSSDNVTCLVADVVEGSPDDPATGHARSWSAPPPTCAPGVPAAPRPAACSAATAPATPASSSRSGRRSPTRSASPSRSDPIADPEARPLRARSPRAATPG